MPRYTLSALIALSLGASSSALGDEPAGVRVRNIGLHIGGGPNDARTKAPFLRQIAAQFDSFRECYAKVEVERERGTFGIDLLIPKEGGHADTSNARTGMHGAAFKDCVIGVFQGIAFDPPQHGVTKLSYALAFEPG